MKQHKSVSREPLRTCILKIDGVPIARAKSVRIQTFKPKKRLRPIKNIWLVNRLKGVKRGFIFN